MKQTEKAERYVLQETGQQKSHRVRRMPEILVAFFLLCGFFGSFEDMYYARISLVLTISIGMLVFCLLEIYKTDEKKLKRTKTVLFIVCIVAFIGMSIFVIQGLLDLCNRFLSFWNVRFEAEISRFSVGSYVGIGSVVLWAILAAVIGYLIFEQLEKHRFYGVMLLVLAALWMRFVLETSQQLWPVLALLAGVIGLMILHTTEGRLFAVRGSAYVVAGLVVAAVIALAGVGYQSSDQIENWKKDLQVQWQKWRYGEDSLPQGDLQEAAGLLDGDQVTLHVETDTFSEMYLRGFVGGEYDGTSWKALSKTRYQNENDGMLRWLKQRGFLPETQYAAYHELTDAALSIQPEYDTVSIKNENAYRKYLYLPATAVSWDGGNAAEEKDWQVQSKKFRGADSYTFEQVKSAPMANDATQEDWLEKQTEESQQLYLESEAVYHSFVSDNYTEISDSLSEYLTDTFFPDTEDISELDFTEITKQIRKVLRENTTYTEHPETVPEQTEFIHWFLQSEKKGNAVAYATTAVMAYRAAGYPARYVEGYHISSAQAEALSGRHEADLTAKNAHAWVEVYQAGIGWLPVEVVPGMYVEDYTNQMVAGQPAYQVNQTYEDDGIDTSTETGKTDHNSDGTGDESETERWLTPIHFVGVVLIILYIVLAAYLLLELQRAIRLHQRRQKTQVTSSTELVDLYLPRIYVLYHIRKIEGNSTNRENIWEQLQEKFPDLEYGEYRRVLKLIQKVKFGEKELHPYEKHALESFYYLLIRQCYENSNLWWKIRMRYFYCFELAGGHRLW